MIEISTLLVYILAVSVSCIDAKGTNEATGVKAKPEERIIGGESVTPGEFPHQILLVQRAAEGGVLCGASLITTEWILTAAHCALRKRRGTFEITAGRHRAVNSRGDDPGQQNTTDKEIFIHPCYLGEGIDPAFNNDIALIKLTTPFTLNDTVKIIQIDEKGRANPGSQTTAIGWGRISPITAENAQELQKANLSLPEIAVCENLVPFINVGSQICVNPGRKSVCSGDSGGPLLCKDGGINYVCGIASFAQDFLCVVGFNVFVRVSHYKDWIKEVMESGRNSQADCVRPRTTTLRTTTDSVVTTELEIIDDQISRAGHSLYKQPLRGIYISTILVLFLFTY